MTETLAPPNDTTCFKCGADTMVSLTKLLVEDYGVEISFSTGYASTALWDGSTFMMKVCEKCMKEWMLTFKHRPLHSCWLDTRGECIDVKPASDDDMRLVPHMLTCTRHGVKYNHTADECCPACAEEIEDQQGGPPYKQG